MVALLVGLARQFCDLLGLQGLGQGVQCVNALQVGARAFGVFADPVGQACSGAQCSIGQDLRQRHLLVAAEVQRRGHQIERSFGGLGCSIVHGSTAPAARSSWQVRISGRPISAVGSSLTMASSSAMPSPSLLALPAQS